MPTTMSLTRALTRLKTIKAQIHSSIIGMNAIGVVSSGKLIKNSNTPVEFAEKAKSGNTSIRTLIDNRDAIKRALVLKNASTDVEIAGVTYSIAAAIERKNSISFEKEYYETLQAQLNAGESLLERSRIEVDKLRETLIGQLNSQKANPDAASIAEKTHPYPEFLDPLDLKNNLSVWKQGLADFEADVDAALSEVNARNEIIVDF